MVRDWERGQHLHTGSTPCIAPRSWSGTGREGNTYTLVEFPVAPSGHGRVVPAIDLCYVVALDGLDFVHGEVSGKGHLDGRLRQTEARQQPDRVR